jgi:hypothetical protein
MMDIGGMLKKYYDVVWKVSETEKWRDTGNGFYQKYAVYKSPAYIYYIWSASREESEDYFDSQVVGYASASAPVFLNDIADELEPGISVSAVKEAFLKNDRWSAAKTSKNVQNASTPLAGVKPVPGETKIFYNDTAAGSSVAVSFKNSKAYFWEYFNNGGYKSVGGITWDSGGNGGRETDLREAFVMAIGEMKLYEWQKPFNEWVWKAKSGGMESISRVELSLAGAKSGDLPGATCAVYRGNGKRETVFVIYVEIPDDNDKPIIGGWRNLGKVSGASYPEYSVNISGRKGRETVSFRKNEAWVINCGRLSPYYREYRDGTAAVFNERTKNGSRRFWIVDIKP